MLIYSLVSQNRNSVQEVQDDSYADAEEEGRRREQEISMERERVEETMEDKEVINPGGRAGPGASEIVFSRHN